MILKLVALALGLGLYLTSGDPSLAQNDHFRLTYDITYSIQPSGKAKVVQRSTITNLTTERLAGKTTVKIANLAILSPKAYDYRGLLELKQSSESGVSRFDVALPNAASGKDKKYSWTLAFETFDLVVKQGNSYQVYIPNPGAEAADFKITVITPQEFGSPSVLKPEPDEGLIWTKANLGNRAISLLFSPEFSAQHYQINIKYLLENKRSTPAVAFIPVPSSTPYQRFFWEKSDPRPLDVTADPDGNFLAKFYLGAGKREEITVSGIVKVFSKPVLTDYGDKASRSGQFKLTGVPKMASAEEIYRFVVNRYTYGPNAFSDRPVGELISAPGAVSCEEMTKLFTAISSDQGFLAKPVFGLLFPNRDRFHCWAQYLDPQLNRFVWVDPALEQQSQWDYFRQGDLAHIAIYSGTKLTPKMVPIVQFEAKPTLDFDPDRLEATTSIRADFSPTTVSGRELSGTVIVNNAGPGDTGPIDVHLNATKLQPVSPIIHLSNLPPFSQRTFTVNFKPTQWTDSYNDIITIGFSEATYSFPVAIRPFYQTKVFIIVFCAVALLIATQIARRLHFQR